MTLQKRLIVTYIHHYIYFLTTRYTVKYSSVNIAYGHKLI